MFSFYYLGVGLLGFRKFNFLRNYQDFPGGLVIKNLPAKAGDMCLMPGPGRFCILWGN